MTADRGEPVLLSITPAHIAAMVPGLLRDELAYQYRTAVRRAADREDTAEDWAAHIATEAEAVRARAVINHADFPGLCEARRAHLDSPHIWNRRTA